MQKEIKISIIVLIVFLAFLWLEKPTRTLLSSFQIDDIVSKFTSGILIRTILIGGIITLMIQFKLIEFAGLASWKKVKNIQATFIALAIIMMGLLANWNTYINTPFGIIILFITYTLIVGIVEELLFRGTIFPLFIRALKNNKRPIILSAVLSSLMFGAIHFVNLFKQPDNLMGIISQVFFALSIGVFFCGLMIRTENIIIPCLIHGLVNFTFGAGQLKQNTEETSMIVENASADWNSFIPTALFFTFIFLGGVYMILKSNKENILTKLEVE